MKKIILAAAMALVAGAAFAISPEELRIYINPGHGSWTGNDRPLPLINHGEYQAVGTDTCGFFESNTNLIKGFGVLEKLIEAGFPFDRTKNQDNPDPWKLGAAMDLEQNLVMSRVKNGPYWPDGNTRDKEGWDVCNRNLAEVAAEVEYNNFDMFISIHSNATTDGSSINYPIFMYRGTNGKSGVLAPGSWEMSEAAWPYASGQEHMTWSSSSTYIVGDLNWMGGGPDKGSTVNGYYGYLAVLKHSVPGYLVEGYFHTYQPGRHRAMNFDADLIEGYQYARGVLDYFGLEKTKTGEIYGIVRDAHEKFTHTYYKPAARTVDQYMPLNEVHVVLKKDGEQIAEYTTDVNYNGGFVFLGLEPGVYVVECDHPDYKKCEPMEVEVKANLTSYPKMFLENKNYTAGVNMEVNYPDPLAGGPFGPGNSYEMAQSFVDQPLAEVAGKTIRRSILRNGYLYILALDENNAPTVVVYNANTLELLATLGTEVCEGTELALSDIQVTSDGFLVGCAKELNQYSDDYVDAGLTRGELWFYKWSNDPQTGVPTGEAKQWFSYAGSGLWYRSYAGDTFCYSGSTADGTIAISTPTVSNGHQLRYAVIPVTDDKAGSPADIKPYRYLYGPDHYFYSDELGDGYRFVTAPYNDGRFLMIGSGDQMGVVEWSFSANDLTADVTYNQEFHPTAYLNTEIVPANVDGINFFCYSGRAYMAVADLDEGKVCGVKLYDVTDGIENPVLVSTSNTQVEGAEAAKYATLGSHAAVLTEEGDVVSADLAMLLIRDGKVSRFTTEGVKQAETRGNYAYDLAFGEVVDNKLPLNFKVTGAVKDARIVLTDRENGETSDIELGALEAGEHSYSVDLLGLDSNKSYNWAVAIDNEAVRNTSVLYTAEPNDKASRGGVTWINDTESDNFGYIVVTQGFAQGIDVYTPALERQGRYFVGAAPFQNKLNSPFRVGTRNGIAYITDWTDKGAGYWMFDAKNPDQLVNFIEGENDGKGAFVLDGKVIGGGSTCVGFLGTGADTKMFSFVEDYPEGNYKDFGLQRYDIGTATSLAIAPTKSFANLAANTLMSGTNVEVCCVDNGLFVSQARAVGTNTAESPCFVYIDVDGNVLLNSYSLGDFLDSSGAGIAINAERDILAVAEKGTGIGLWRVTWENGVPALQKMYMIPGSAGADEITQLAFDCAGNLYSFHRGTEGFAAYTVRSDAKTVTTPAKSSLVITSDPNGVESIVLGAQPAGTVEYYNLQGQRISAQNLIPGYYIQVKGNTASKVLVK